MPGAHPLIPPCLSLDGEVIVSSGADSMLCLIQVQGGEPYINLQVPDPFR